MSEMTQEERNAIIRKRIMNLTSMEIVPKPPDSPYVKVLRLKFEQDGRKKIWDVIKLQDSVAIIIFNVSRKKLVFVRQFRPACYLAAIPEKSDEIDVDKYPATLGLTLELCAGTVDKNITLVEIAREEVMEECGYDPPLSAFEKINSYRSGTGAGSASQTLYYVEVTDEMKTLPGGGAESEGELIEIVEMSVQELKDYISSGNLQSPPAFLYGVTWFLSEKQDRFR